MERTFDGASTGQVTEAAPARCRGRRAGAHRPPPSQAGGACSGKRQGLARSRQADEARRMPVHPHARGGSRWRLGTAPIARPASGSARSSEPLPSSQIATSQKSRWISIRMNRTILLPSLSRREGGKGCLSAGVRRWQGSQRGFNQRSEDDPLRSRNARAALYRAGGMARTGA